MSQPVQPRQKGRVVIRGGHCRVSSVTDPSTIHVTGPTLFIPVIAAVTLMPSLLKTQTYWKQLIPWGFVLYPCARLRTVGLSPFQMWVARKVHCVHGGNVEVLAEGWTKPSNMLLDLVVGLEDGS